MNRQWLRQRVAVLQGVDVLLGMCGALCRVFNLMALEMYTQKMVSFALALSLWQ